MFWSLPKEKNTGHDTIAATIQANAGKRGAYRVVTQVLEQMETRARNIITAERDWSNHVWKNIMGVCKAEVIATDLLI